MRKRILAVLLAILLVTGSTMSRYNSVPVQAAALAPLAEPVIVEVIEVIAGLLGMGAIASGADQGLYGVSQEDAFQLIDKYMIADEVFLAPSFLVELQDGTVLNGTQIRNMWKTAVLDPTMPQTEDDIDWGNLPGEDDPDDPDDPDTGTDHEGGLTDDDKYAIRRAWFDEAYESGVFDPVPPEQEPPQESFSLLKKIFISSGVIAGIGALFEALTSGETEMDPNAFLYPGEDYVFTGIVPQSLGLYHYNGFVTNPGGQNGAYSFDKRNLVCSVIGEREHISVNLGYATSISTFIFDNNQVAKLRGYWYFGYGLDSSRFTLSSGSTGIYAYDGYTYNCNHPVFSSQQAAENYLRTGDYSQALNAPIHDTADLASKINTTLQPLSNKTVNPNTLPAVYQKTSTAAKTVNDTQTQAREQTATDPIANNQTYTETVTETLTDEVQTVPAIETTPAAGTDPTTGTDPATGTDEEMDGDYTVDLREIFPFCLPFDLIRLLRLMDAEPEAPVFEFPFVVPALNIDMTVDIDLSFLDDVMEIWRIGELVLFIIALILGTRKLIKW